MSAKRISVFIFAFLFMTLISFAENSKFKVQLVLTQEESQSKPHETLNYLHDNFQETVVVATDLVLSVDDVQDASIRLREDLLKALPDDYWTIGPDGFKVLHSIEDDKINLTVDPIIEFNLTANGKTKFEEFTKNNLKRSLAVIGDGKVLIVALITEPITSGRIQILSPTDKVNEMVKLVENLGLELKVKPEVDR